MKINFFFLFLLLFSFRLSAQISSQVETYLLSFLNQGVNSKFIIKGEFSFSDTITLSKLPLSAVQKTFTNRAIKIPPEQVLKPATSTEYIPELKINHRMQFTVFFKNDYFTIELNPEENIVYSLSCGIKSGDYTDQLSITFKDNKPNIFNLQKVRTLRTGNVTKYDISEGKRIDFNENSVYSKTIYAEEIEMVNKLLNFGMGIIFYLKNKACSYNDYFSGRKIFTQKHIFFINRALDSLIKLYAMQEQVNENITNLQQVQNAELIIKIIYTNHYKDGRMYEASEPYIVNVKSTSVNMNYYRINTTIREITDKIVKNMPIPVKYCLPIKYNKTVYVYYTKGKVVRIDE